MKPVKLAKSPRRFGDNNCQYSTVEYLMIEVRLISMMGNTNIYHAHNPAKSKAAYQSAFGQNCHFWTVLNERE